MTCRCAFFYHRSIFLRVLIHLVHSRIDLMQPGRLLLCRFRYGRNVAVDFLHFRNDELQSFPGFTNQLHALLYLPVRCHDQVFDFLGGIGGTLGKFTHLLCDDGKTLAGITRSRRFHTGVQRKKVRLKRDLVDYANDVGNFIGGAGDLLHGGDGLLDDFAGFFRADLCATDELARFLRPPGRIPYRRRNFFKCRCRLFHCSSLLLRPSCQVVRRGSDLVGASVDSACILRDLCQRRLQLFGRPVEIAANTIKARHKRLGNPIGHITFRDP